MRHWQQVAIVVNEDMAVGQDPDGMLPAGSSERQRLRIVEHLKLVTRSTELPQDGARLVVQLQNGAHVPEGDDVVAVEIELERIRMIEIAARSSDREEAIG